MVFRKAFKSVPVLFYFYTDDELRSSIRTTRIHGKLSLTLLKNSIKNLSAVRNLPYVMCAAGSLLLFVAPRCGVYNCSILMDMRLLSVIGSSLTIPTPTCLRFYENKPNVLCSFYTLLLTRLDLANSMFYIVRTNMLRMLIFARFSRVYFLINSLRSELN